jgi:hypothetical protein
MTPLSDQLLARARKIHTTILKALCTAGQSATASAIGVHESTVSRWKDGELEKLAAFLAAVGLKVVPVEMHCYPADEIEALKVLARRSDVLRADGLDWED